jgi:hypothetical protein
MTDSIKGKLPNLLELDDAVTHILWAIEKKRPFYAFPRSTAWWLRALRWLPVSWQDAAIARASRRLTTRVNDAS